MANESPLPPEWRCLEGKVHFVRYKGSQEWTSTCPTCGDRGHTGRDAPDRFIMWTDNDHPRAWCRRCDQMFYPDQFGDDRFPKPTHQQIEEWRINAEQRAKEAEQRASEAVAMLQRQQLWLRWHESMGAEGAAYWERRGVPASYQGFWMLGVNPRYRLWTGADALYTPSATIPLQEPDLLVHNVKHRLLNPPNGFGKYRYELAGVGQGLFYCDPEAPLDGHVVLVEGEIKAMVVFVTLETGHTPVLGIPGTSPKEELLTGTLQNADRVTLIMDPGARQAAWELSKAIGLDKVRVLIPPMKIDDGILAGGLNRHDLEMMIRSAIPARRKVAA